MNSDGVTSITRELQKYMFIKIIERSTQSSLTDSVFLRIATFKVVTNGKPSPTKDYPSKWGCELYSMH